MTGRAVFVSPPGEFAADTGVPGDKSLSHRALILAAMAEGSSRVRGVGPGADVAATVAALGALGVTIEGEAVSSPGVAGWRPPAGPLDVANSGTTMRLLSGALAASRFTTSIVGDPSLMRRPMRRLVAPLEALGAALTVSDDGRPPVTIRGRDLRGARVWVPIASAQVRSAVELAALQARGGSVVDSPTGFRDHTERALEAAGRGRWSSATAFEVDPGPLPSGDRVVPGDPSSAAFLLGAAALRPGARVTVRGISLNPGRTGFLDVLSAMGAGVDVALTSVADGEPIGDVTVVGAGLRGTHVSGELTVRCLDELPLVAVLAGVAAGPTTVLDAGELRAKESDRIATTAALVQALGGDVTPTGDGFVVAGGARYRPAAVEAAGDHRIAMSAAVAATACGTVEVIGASAAAVSWPGFASALESVWSSR